MPRSGCLLLTNDQSCSSVSIVPNRSVLMGVRCRSLHNLPVRASVMCLPASAAASSPAARMLDVCMKRSKDASSNASMVLVPAAASARLTWASAVVAIARSAFCVAASNPEVRPRRWKPAPVPEAEPRQLFPNARHLMACFQFLKRVSRYGHQSEGTL